MKSKFSAYCQTGGLQFGIRDELAFGFVLTRSEVTRKMGAPSFAAILLMTLSILGQSQSQSHQSREYPFPSCPTPQLPLPSDPIPLKMILGPWFTIRSVHPPGSPEVDCQIDTYWTNFGEEGNGTEPVVRLLYTQRIAGVMQYHQAAAVNVRHVPGGGGLIHRNWTFNMFGLELPTMLVESDNGRTWSIWHTCAGAPPSPSLTGPETGSGYPIWVLMARERKVDSKLEQELVEKIEAYSGYSQKELRAVGQTNCFA